MDLNRDLPSQLRPFVRDGRISAIPAKRAIRLLLLDEVAQAFEPGRRYPELAVNEILKALHDDHAALRRYLIDEGPPVPHPRRHLLALGRHRPARLGPCLVGGLAAAQEAAEGLQAGRRVMRRRPFVEGAAC